MSWLLRCAPQILKRKKKTKELWPAIKDFFNSQKRSFKMSLLYFIWPVTAWWTATDRMLKCAVFFFFSFFFCRCDCVVRGSGFTELSGKMSRETRSHVKPKLPFFYLSFIKVDQIAENKPSPWNRQLHLGMFKRKRNPGKFWRKKKKHVQHYLRGSEEYANS